MPLTAFRKINLQTCIRSNPLGLHVWFLVRPFVYFHSMLASYPFSVGIRRLSVNMFKRHLPWSHEPDFYLILQYNMYRPGKRLTVFLFRSDKNSASFGNLNLPLTWNGKSGNWHLLLSHCRYCYLTTDILTNVLQKYTFSNSLPTIWIYPNRWIWLVVMATGS